MSGSANYGYALDRLSRLTAPGARLLDYGCGGGSTVMMGRERGLDIVGADIFQVTDRVRLGHEAAGRLGEFIFEMPDAKLPFADGIFDAVCSNTVFEHVEDMDLALAEIRRVLKPGGVLLNIFPTVEVWREGHCGVPFSHWLQKSPKQQVRFLAAMRRLGLGHLTEGKSAEAWAEGFGEYLQRFTFYRPLDEVIRKHRRVFAQVTRDEADFAAYRLRQKSPALGRLAVASPVRPFTRFAISRLAFVVLVARAAA